MGSYIDSLVIHNIDYGYHTPEQAEIALHQLSDEGGCGAAALHTLRASGAIKAIGIGCNDEFRNAHTWDSTPGHEALCERVADLVDLDFFEMAGCYTLLETRAMRRLIPLCRQRNMGMVIAAPLAGGMLVHGASYIYAEPPPH